MRKASMESIEDIFLGSCDLSDIENFREIIASVAKIDPPKTNNADICIHSNSYQKIKRKPLSPSHSNKKGNPLSFPHSNEADCASKSEEPAIEKKKYVENETIKSELGIGDFTLENFFLSDYIPPNFLQRREIQNMTSQHNQRETSLSKQKTSRMGSIQYVKSPYLPRISKQVPVQKNHELCKTIKSHSNEIDVEGRIKNIVLSANVRPSDTFHIKNKLKQSKGICLQKVAHPYLPSKTSNKTDLKGRWTEKLNMNMSELLSEEGTTLKNPPLNNSIGSIICLNVPDLFSIESDTDSMESLDDEDIEDSSTHHNRYSVTAGLLRGLQNHLEKGRNDVNCQNRLGNTPVSFTQDGKLQTHSWSDFENNNSENLTDMEIGLSNGNENKTRKIQKQITYRRKTRSRKDEDVSKLQTKDKQYNTKTGKERKEIPHRLKRKSQNDQNTKNNQVIKSSDNKPMNKDKKHTENRKSDPEMSYNNIQQHRQSPVTGNDHKHKTNLHQKQSSPTRELTVKRKSTRLRSSLGYGKNTSTSSEDGDIHKSEKVSSLFTLSKLDHAWNSILPMCEVRLFSEKLEHSSPLQKNKSVGEKQKKNTNNEGESFKNLKHPGGIWQSIVNEN